MVGEMKAKKTILSLLRHSFLLALIPLAFLIIRAAEPIGVNREIRSGFTGNGERGPYSRRVPMRRMDVAQIPGMARTLILNTQMIRGVMAPIDLHYYTAQNRLASPAMVIPKGTLILIEPMNVGGRYGLTTLPAYNRGWRYAKPFLVIPEEDIYWPMAFKGTDGPIWEWPIYPALERHRLAIEELPYLFIRTEELEAVLKEFTSINGLSATFEFYFTESLTRQRSWLHMDDYALYFGGVYIAPDLFDPVLDGLNAALILAAAGILAGYAILRLYALPRP
jgi:hypothetical protein